ncbi:MAG: chromosomal replication initiator protein DnaA [Parcubacteria group bacterium Gr01-1014_30]|nr:MAG: chromosomal replication initiator protein DnaA [Parcubacteria group bacterium Gr01-1014_30]
MTGEELWQAVLAQIQLSISPANFATWFKNTGIASVKGGEVYVSVPNSFTKEWLEKKYDKAILKILHSLDDAIKEVKYIITRPSALKIDKRKGEQSWLAQDQLEFDELKVDRETNLNPRYTFENFVVGPFNELPHAASLAVSKNPGFVYNPLFIYGGVGLGKTHLLQAVGNEVVKNVSSKKVKYVSAEKFISGVISSIKNQKMEAFKTQYHQVDVLVLDDVQFLAGKEKTQEEFFHIFNSLYEKNRQIVISSDRSPKTIPALAERLRSRFEGGMLADISSPDFETRVAILKAKAAERQLVLVDEIFEYIASNIQKNIREMEGALNRLVAYQKLQNQPPDAQVAKRLLKNVVLAPTRIATPNKIISAVANFYDLKEKDLVEASRKREIVWPRQIAMFLLRNELKCSFPFIGRRFNGKDHTTAIYAYEKIVREYQQNEKLGEEIELIKRLVYET